VAIVSGRPIAQIDALLGDAPYALAGEHGTAIRHAPATPVEWLPMPATPPHWLTQARMLTQQHQGVLLEHKHYGFVLHYRAAPAAGEALHAALQRLLAEAAHGYELMAAKMAWEIRPKGADKATAVQALMARPPFLGRLPVFVGDDVTDEDGMRAARALGGIGLFVPEVFGDPAGVRAWVAALARQSEGDAWPA
jgi:trehalose 6-phosphate phosphatase